MTDHGGAASPRTEPMYEVPGSLLDELRERRRAAQEAPAPEGLRERFIAALVGRIGAGPSADCAIEALDDAMHDAALAAYRAEARPPEGLRAALADIEAHASRSTSKGGGEWWARGARWAAARMETALAARLPAGGATKP
jgi:hypothetical protein